MLFVALMISNNDDVGDDVNGNRSSEMPTEVPVLIIGGGAAGLSTSIFLAELGVESLLVERHPGTALVPKAHIIHCRTLEILSQVELEDEVRRQG